MADDWTPPELHTDVPHPARIYDYWLGGKANYPPDRAVARQVIAMAPEAPENAKANRAFMRRAVRLLATEYGIRQFIDVGSGLPTVGNVHEVAQKAAPDAKVVYVDNDPIVLVHADALLRGAGETVAIAGDLHDPAGILAHPQVRDMIDLDAPVAVLLVAIVHFLRDDEDPRGIVRQFTDAVVPGSFLVLSHLTADGVGPERGEESLRVWRRNEASVVPTLRPRAEIEGFFDGVELLDPGVVPVAAWRPDTTGKLIDDFWLYGGVGRKN